MGWDEGRACRSSGFLSWRTRMQPLAFAVACILLSGILFLNRVPLQTQPRIIIAAFAPAESSTAADTNYITSYQSSASATTTKAVVSCSECGDGCDVFPPTTAASNEFATAAEHTLAAAPWLLGPRCPCFPYARTTDLENLAQELAETKGAWGKALSVIFFDPGTPVELLQNTIFSMVHFGDASSYVVVAWRSQEVDFCRQLNVPVADVREFVSQQQQQQQLTASENGGNERKVQLQSMLAWAKHAVVLRLLELGYAVHAVPAGTAFVPFKNIWASYERYADSARASIDGVFQRNYGDDSLSLESFVVLPSERVIALWRALIAIGDDLRQDGQGFTDKPDLRTLKLQKLFHVCEDADDCVAVAEAEHAREVEPSSNEANESSSALFRTHRAPWYPKFHPNEGIKLEENLVYCSTQQPPRVPAFDACSPYLLHARLTCQREDIDEKGKHLAMKRSLQAMGMWYLNGKQEGDADNCSSSSVDGPEVVVPRYRPLFKNSKPGDDSASSTVHSDEIYIHNRFKSCKIGFAFEEKEEFRFKQSWQTGRGSAESETQLLKIDAREIIEPPRPGPEATFLEVISTCRTLKCLRDAHARLQNKTTTSPQDAPRFNFPHALLVGYQKSATTSMHFYLGRHKQTRTTVRKEPEFFTLKCRGDPMEGCSWGQQAFYLEDTMQKAKYVDSNGTRMHIESSTHYAMNGDVLAPGIREAMPWVKIIISLREPISRAASMLIHMMARNRNGCLVQADATLYQCLKSSSQLVGRPGPWNYLDSPHGNYSFALSAWMKSFPREQLHVVQYETVVADDERSEAELKRLEQFLDLSEELNGAENPSLEGLNMRKDKIQPQGWPMRRREYEDLINLVRPDAETVARLVEDAGQGNAADWLALWEHVWQSNLETCDSNGNCMIQLS